MIISQRASVFWSYDVAKVGDGRSWGTFARNPVNEKEVVCGKPPV